jgi:diguanylate cyclase (GGDEF)-like protein
VGRTAPVWVRVCAVLGLLLVTLASAAIAWPTVRGPEGQDPVALGVALGIGVAAALWPLLPGPVGRTTTIGWVQATAVGVMFWAGIVNAVVLVGLTTLLVVVVDVSRGAPTLARTSRLLGLGATVALAGLCLYVWELPAGQGLDSSSGAVLLLAAGVVVVLGSVLDTIARTAVRVHDRGTPWRVAVQAEAVGAAVAASHLLAAPMVGLALLHAPLLVLPLVLLLTAVELLGALGAASRTEALRDPLTGLANRRHLERRLTRAVASARTSGHGRAVPGQPGHARGGCALLLIDLDSFKEINDEHGHAAGDAVLQGVARRLRRVAGPQALVARLGGDEFAILLPQVRDREVAEQLAHRVRQALTEPIALPADGGAGTGPLLCGGSVGVALAPAHAVTPADLLERADAAMYTAKRNDGVAVHGDGGESHVESRREVVASLRRALDSRDVRLVYQPQVLLGAGPSTSPHGVEALLRWDDAARGPVPPDSFIPLAEQAGLIGRLTGVVLELALEQSAAWLRAGQRVPVAVNVSLRDLEDPGFADRTARAMVATGVPSSLLTLEVTERVLAGDLTTVGRTMERLHAMGVRLSLDDFGTGWSSLLLLRRLPVDELKLDRSFVSGVSSDGADEVVVRSVIGLAHELGLLVLAEGVEDAATMQVLAGLGCDAAQGWHVGRPMEPADAVAWFEAAGRRAGDGHPGGLGSGQVPGQVVGPVAGPVVAQPGERAGGRLRVVS